MLFHLDAQDMVLRLMEHVVSKVRHVKYQLPGQY